MSDLMREEFEAWISKESPSARLNICSVEDGYRYCIGQYVSTRVQSLWVGWKASRECLVIELPKPYAVIGDYADCGGGRTVWDAEFSEKITDRMCKKTAVYDKTIFEALGLKVKP